MRDTERNRTGQRSGRPWRGVDDPVEQAGTMGKRWTVRGNDRPTLDPILDHVRNRVFKCAKCERVLARPAARINGVNCLHTFKRRKHYIRSCSLRTRRFVGVAIRKNARVSKRHRERSNVTHSTREIVTCGPAQRSRPAGIGGDSSRGVPSNAKRTCAIATRSAGGFCQRELFCRCR